MSIHVTVSAEIARPRAEVASFTCDPDHDTQWYVNIKEVEWLTDRPAQVGSRVARVAYFLGKRIAYTYVIDELIPEERLLMRAEAGPFPMQTLYEFEDLGPGRTRMSVTNRGGPEGWFGLASPLLAWQVRSALTKDLAKLKRLLEGA